MVTTGYYELYTGIIKPSLVNVFFRTRGRPRWLPWRRYSVPLVFVNRLVTLLFTVEKLSLAKGTFSD